MDKRPDASGRPKPREGSLGPNGVSNKFLAELVGKNVDVGFSGSPIGLQSDFVLWEGVVLLRFDSYAIVIREAIYEMIPDPKGSTAWLNTPKGEREVCIWKGPGLFVRPARS